MTAPSPERRRRRLGRGLSLLLATLLVATGSAMTLRARATPLAVETPVALPPAMVEATLRLDGAVVRGADRDWARERDRPPGYGEPVPVEITAYCLKGLTRRDHEVREGIVAADPRMFPLGRYIDLYVGRTYHGRFLVDDTGRAIKYAILDVWTPTCSAARRFGRRRGTAVLVPRPRGADRDTLTTGSLGGVVVR